MPLKRIIAVFLTFVFLFQALDEGIIMLDFYANRDQIARDFCVNKNRPITLCYGSCVLTKRLKQEESKKQQHPEKRGENKEFLLSTTDSGFDLQFIALIRSYRPYKSSPVLNQPLEIFRPPCIS